MSMVTQAASTSSLKNRNGGSKTHHSPYLERVREALSRALSKMEPYNIPMKSAEKSGTRLPFYPHVELGSAPIETELIEDLQKIRPFGVNINKNVVSPHHATNNANAIQSEKNGWDASMTINATKNNLSATTRKRESCFIEWTSNSVRVSFLFKAQARAKVDPLEASIVFQWMRFLMVQEQHPILRKTPIEGYSVTFLVTNKHLAIHGSQRVEDSILGFCAKIDKESSDIKLQVNAQARYVTAEFLKAFNNQTEEEEKCN